MNAELKTTERQSASELKKTEIAFSIRNLVVPSEGMEDLFPNYSKQNLETLNEMKRFLSNDRMNKGLDKMYEVIFNDVRNLFLDFLDESYLSSFDNFKFIMGNGIVLPREISLVPKVKNKKGEFVNTFELAMYCNQCVCNKYLLPSVDSNVFDQEFLKYWCEYLAWMLKTNYPNCHNFKIASFKEFEKVENDFIFTDGTDNDEIESRCLDHECTVYLIQYDPETLELLDEKTKAMDCYGQGDVLDSIEFFEAFQSLNPNEYIKLGVQI